MYVKKGVVVSLIIIICLMQSALVFGATGFTNDQQLVFTGTSSSPSTLYQDAIGNNLDAGIELCDQGSGKFVGGFYALSVSGSGFISSLITYGSSSLALSQASSAGSSGSCFTQSGAGFLTVSPSALSTPNPNVDKAAFPGKLWIGYASSANPGAAGIEGYEFAGANAQLRGSYSASQIYDQSSGLVSVTTPTISFQTSSSAFSKSATDTIYGVAGDRKMVMGVCSDTDGASCNDGALISSNVFPISLNTGIVSPGDQVKSDRNIVINGLNYPFCIGANLETGINSISPNPVYYSQTLSVTTNIVNDLETAWGSSNGGNVDVTTDFEIDFQIRDSLGTVVHSESRIISSTLVPDGATLEVFSWPAYGLSGTYTARIEVDSDANIVECNEADNVASSTFELKAITLPDIYIDGVKTSEFEYPNTPYNVTFEMKNSDNLTLPNASVIVVEKNGLNLLGPTQIYNQTTQSNTTVKSGLVSNNSIAFRTNGTGFADIVMIPTYNSLYEPQYGYTNLADYIGTYELYLSGSESDGEPFIFIESGLTTPKYELTIGNTSYAGPYAQKDVSNTMINQVLDFIYDTFVVFVKTVVN